MTNQTWKNYHAFAHHRGELVFKILNRFISLPGMTVLDIGCGNGATASVLARQGAQVTALEIIPEPLPNISQQRIKFINGGFDGFQFNQNQFDVIILQDVLEHLPDPARSINKMSALLSRGGHLYFSTPNRFSFFNLISDPHWGLPLVSLFPRSWVKILIFSTFRIDRRQRNDWPALLSMKRLLMLLNEAGFKLQLMNKFAATQLFECPQSIVCKPVHLNILKWLAKHNFQTHIQKIVNDRIGFFNNYINPTWYGVCIKT
ncbi:MAG: methyltransferase domain-containing protein [bacterium]|nr:methyltransferase domain-containing protein [bacterium]